MPAPALPNSRSFGYCCKCPEVVCDQHLEGLATLQNYYLYCIHAKKIGKVTPPNLPIHSLFNTLQTTKTRHVMSSGIAYLQLRTCVKTPVESSSLNCGVQQRNKLKSWWKRSHSVPKPQRASVSTVCKCVCVCVCA